MAKRKHPPVRRTVTTRAQARNLQEVVSVPKRTITKKQAKKDRRNKLRLLKARMGMENVKNKDKAVSKVANTPTQSNKNNPLSIHIQQAISKVANTPSEPIKNDPLSIHIQEELEKLRKLDDDKHKDIFVNRHISLCESPNGKSIQITCKNLDKQDIKEESKVPIKFDSNWSDAGASTSEDNLDNTPLSKIASRLSLSTQSKLFIQNLQGTTNIVDQNKKNEKIPNDESNDVICLDSIDDLEEMESNDDLICLSDTKSDSCILIDDDDDNIGGSNVNLKLIDLTSPNFVSSKDTNSKRNQQTQNNLVASHNFPSTSTQGKSCSEFPVRLMEPPAVLVPQESQLNDSFRYNHHSNIYGSNFLTFGSIRTTGLRPIFIDGNNIAMLHSHGRFFSVIGLKICIDYFKMRGHDVTAIVPQIRKRKNQSSDPKLLFKLEKEGCITFTPSRVINGKTIVPYDDRFIVQLAAVYQGVIISCDNYKDLLAENPNLRDAIENRVLNPTFVKNMIIFPSDPLGQYGPKLDDFLKF